MTSQLPWPSGFLAPGSWSGIRRIQERCLHLVRQDALPQTLMLIGEPGLGREALALGLGAGLVCRADSEPGCQCPSCERVYRNVHPDVEVIGILPDKTTITIEQARQLADGISRSPFESSRRVFIVSSAENPPLGEHAASAMLKTLEEPPSHVTLILLAANPGRTLSTIVSRSVQLRVPPPTDDELGRLIASLHGCDETVARGLITACKGIPSTAIALAEPETMARVSEISSLLPLALRGDGLALLRACAAIKQLPGGMSHAAEALLGELAGAAEAEAELLLDAAAALIVGDARRAVLNIDVETAAVGALASLAGRCG